MRKSNSPSQAVQPSPIGLPSGVKRQLRSLGASEQRLIRTLDTKDFRFYEVEVVVRDVGRTLLLWVSERGEAPRVARVGDCTFCGEVTTSAPLENLRDLERVSAAAGILPDPSHVCPKQDMPQDPDPDYGARILSWALKAQDMVHRRDETVHLLDDVSALREIIVDFEVPSGADRWVANRCSVALALLSKRHILGLSVRDERGEPVPVCTRSEASWASWSALVYAATAALGERPSMEIVDDLRTVAADPPEFALRTILVWREQTGRSLGGGKNSQAQRLRLLGDRNFARLLYLAARRRILLVKALGGAKRRIITYSFLTNSRGLRGLASKMGWRPTRFGFRILSIGIAKSYQFKIDLPEGLEVARADLWATWKDPGKEATVVERDIGRPTGGGRVALYLRRVPWDALGRAEVRFWPIRGTVIIPATLSALLTALLLTLGTFFADRIVGAEEAAATVVALVGILSALIARPGEHALVSRCLVGVRLAVGGSALVAYAGAVTLVIDFGEEPQELAALGAVWSVLAAMAWFIVSALSFAWARKTWTRWLIGIGVVVVLAVLVWHASQRGWVSPFSFLVGAGTIVLFGVLVTAVARERQRPDEGLSKYLGFDGRTLVFDSPEDWPKEPEDWEGSVPAKPVKS